MQTLTLHFTEPQKGLGSQVSWPPHIARVCQALGAPQGLNPAHCFTQLRPVVLPQPPRCSPHLLPVSSPAQAKQPDRAASSDPDWITLLTLIGPRLWLSKFNFPNSCSSFQSRHSLLLCQSALYVPVPGLPCPVRPGSSQLGASLLSHSPQISSSSFLFTAPGYSVPIRGFPRFFTMQIFLFLHL